MQFSDFVKLLLLLTVIITSSAPVDAAATEEYARKTGNECKVCHLDPLGGGELTETGKGYLLAISPERLQDSISRNFVSQVIQLVTGYIHIVTAFLWFGTILYVHLVLKPAYASMGLPKSEALVGLVSMGIMAVTGAILTYYRVPSWDFFVSSKFGILLLIKIAVFMLMTASALYVVLVIGPKLKRKAKIEPSGSGHLTQAELASFDGENGRPAYLAYKGRIYDVSRSHLWEDGNHMKRHQAGVDLTDMLPQAPHDEDKILTMPEVGQLSTEQTTAPDKSPKRFFYFLAYLNLCFVFVISCILALWRWL